ncbi:MAG: sulfonate ABC transporter permease [Oscillatoriales cyanobacterium CG2_30_44_21]|nr:MAG: sulfonate ABC transporter permease [Oscillatoriales cyanobacterium CG2_30_44_21]
MTSKLTAVPVGSFLVNEVISSSEIKFSLIVPTYNESKNLAKLVDILTRLLNDYHGDRYELIIVDDDSPDLTWQVGLELMPNYPHLKIMRRQGEKGLSTAVIRGWQTSQGEVLGVIDGDLQHPPETLIKMLDAIAAGADLTVASRHVEGGGVSDWGFIRRVLSRGAQMLGLLILPNVIGRVSDPMSGYFMVRRSAIANHAMNPLGYKILIEVLGRGDIGTVTEVGYVFQERQEGESKVTWRQYVDYILHLLRLRSRGRISKIRQKFQIPVQRFLSYGLVGLSGVFVDMSIFYLLGKLGWGLTSSKIISSEVAVLNNFLWNDLWTFRDISSRQIGWKKLVKRFLKFNIICLIGIGLNLIILNFLYNYFKIDKNLANLIAIAIVTIWNFWFNLKLSWRVTQTK